ncbi:MAG: hypothetical protein EXS09_21390 [Gemmataceae bacterium]|nr:hypothetical protein [Gemmataceae bacterium]
MAKKRKNVKFPLFLHGSGQWAKKIRGRTRYFGKDKDAALEEYVRVREDLEAGRAARPKADAGLTVADLCNSFLTSKRQRVDAGELSSEMWSVYHKACEGIVDLFGRDRSVMDLRPSDFGKLRNRFTKRLGPFAVAKSIQVVKTVFIYAFKSELIQVPIRYGDQFDKPPRRVMRLERSKRGEKLIEPADAWKLIDAALPQLRAMILLGLNCGYGQSDCSNLQRDALTVKPGWLNAPRQKTGVGRRCPLWPETIAAIDAVNADRPEPKDEADAGCVFVTYKGYRWVKFRDRGLDMAGTRNDSAGQEFTKLARRCEVKLTGGMYILRHTFRTVADAVNDRVAVDCIMGHADDSMGATYREKVADERLERVSNHVREWLLKNKPVSADAPDVLRFKAS